jgi:hypothetical protein
MTTSTGRPALGIFAALGALSGKKRHVKIWAAPSP